LEIVDRKIRKEIILLSQSRRSAEKKNIQSKFATRGILEKRKENLQWRIAKLGFWGALLGGIAGAIIL